MNNTPLRQQLLSAVWMNPSSPSAKLATIPHPPAKRSSVTKCLSRMVKDGQLVRDKEGLFILHSSVDVSKIFKDEPKAEPVAS